MEEKFTQEQIDILRCIGVRVELHESGSQIVNNVWHGLAQEKLDKILGDLGTLLDGLISDKTSAQERLGNV